MAIRSLGSLYYLYPRLAPRHLKLASKLESSGSPFVQLNTPDSHQNNMLSSQFTSLLLLLLSTPLVSSQACTPSEPPFTNLQNNITEYREIQPSRRPPDNSTSYFQFDFYDPNTCFGPITCRHEWIMGLGEPGPRDGFWPCSSEHPDILVLHTSGQWVRNGTLQVKYNHVVVDP